MGAFDLTTHYVAEELMSCMCVCVCMYMLYVCVYVCIYVYMCVYVSVYVSVSVCQCVCVYARVGVQYHIALPLWRSKGNLP